MKPGRRNAGAIPHPADTGLGSWNDSNKAVYGNSERGSQVFSASTEQITFGEDARRKSSCSIEGAFIAIVATPDRMRNQNVQ
jgi:hypothetical protein